MEVYERIKHLRKNVLKITQEQFAATLNISRPNVGNIECGRTGITDRLISDICEVYNVNETWLRTGEGEIFRKKSVREEFIDVFSELMMDNDDDDEDDFRMQFIVALSKLDRKEWAAIEKFARSIVENRKETKKEEET